MQEPTLPDRASAIFLDFDGTLAEIAPHPDAVRVSPDIPALLAQLGLALGGAVAVISGRTVAEIDRLLHPLHMPVAGVHGTERRATDGQLRRIAVPGLEQAAEIVQGLVSRHPSLHLERKPGALALHYRQAEALEDECLATMSEAMRYAEGMTLLRGKKVVELKPRRASKGAAVRAFLEERPFRHRQPWFFGDDVTDEAAFEVVQSLGGVAIKIGEGDTMATHRLADPAAMRHWLARAAEHLSGQPAAGIGA